MPVKILGFAVTSKRVATFTAMLIGVATTVITWAANTAWADHNRIQAHESAMSLIPSIAAATQTEAVNRQTTALEIVGIKEDVREIREMANRIDTNVFNLARRGGIYAATRPAVR